MDESERYYYIIQANDWVCLRRLLREGADVNHVFWGLGVVGVRPNRWSGLHLCCEKGHVECAKELLDAGADPNVYDRWNWTPIVYAVQGEWHDMIALLLNYQADLNIQDKKGCTVIHSSVENSDTECLQMLLEHNADPSIGDSLGRTPLWQCASADGNGDSIMLLLNSGSCGINDYDVSEKRNPLQSAIMHASRDRMQYVRLLLDAGCDVNNRDVRNHTALMNVIWRSWADGADVRDDDMEICRLIVQHNYNLNGSGKKLNWLTYAGPAISFATERGAEALVVMLLEQGANPDITDQENTSCVLLAVDLGRKRILGQLIKYNANLDLQGQVRINKVPTIMTPLQCAIMHRHFDIAMLLVQAGCDVTKETYLWTNRNVPESLVLNCEMWTWMRDFVREPHTLLFLCKTKLRRMLGSRLRNRLDELRLPPYTATLIKMADLVAHSV